MQPKVSIVIPCYNKEKYIANMFDSILAQEWNRIELILVNDGSTDGTREIIAVYQKKFIQRGYDVIIIDQENQGLAAAVRNGFLRFTGDFVCQVDADDELEPDYISSMASWLVQNPEYDWVICDAIMIKNGSEIYQKAIPTNDYDVHNLYGYLLAKMIRPVWVFLVRTTYFKKCNVAELFYVGRDAHQEPQFFIPLALGGGKIKYIEKPLYKWLLDFAENSAGHLSYDGNYENAKKRLLGFLNARNEVINRMPINIIDKQKYKAVSELHWLGLIVVHSTASDDMTVYKEAMMIFTNRINKYFNQSLDNDENFLLLHAAMEDNLLCIKPTNINVESTRVIGWGALGKYAKMIIKNIENTPLQPDEFWDVMGDGEIVKKPEINMLSNHDTVLVLTQLGRNTAGIVNSIKDTGCKIITSDEIVTYLASKRYPQFYDGSVKLIY